MSNTTDLTDAISHHTAELAAQGFCIIPDALPPDIVAALDADLAEDFARTPFGQGSFYGSTTKRFGRLLVRSPVAVALVQHRLILGIVETVLSPWCDCIQLNTTQAIAVHPGAPAQLPHRDQDMWRGPVGEIEYLVNVMWPLTPFTHDNGATLVWPHSHGRRALDADLGGESVAAEMAPGRPCSSSGRRCTVPVRTPPIRSGAASWSAIPSAGSNPMRTSGWPIRR